MNNTTITTKESYLSAVREWKAAYRKLSADQRALKREVREAQRDGNAMRTGDLYYTIARNKAVATGMLEERRAMKVAAAEAWVLAHQQEAAAA